MAFKMLLPKYYVSLRNPFPSILADGGIGIFILFVTLLFAPIAGEKQDWAMYISLLVSFPVLLIWKKYATNYLLSGIFFAVVYIAYIILQYFHFKVFIASAGLVSILLILLVRQVKERIKFKELMALGITFIISALLSYRLAWWDINAIAANAENAVYLLTLLVIGSFLAFNYFFPIHKHENRNTNKSNAFFTLFSFILFAFLSLRVAAFSDVQVFHWGTYVGPAELVQQGAWLLSSVHSTYGFLSILSIAFLPFENAWQSLYFLNALFLFVSTCIFFKVLTHQRQSILNQFFSLLIVIACQFLFIGWVPDLSGPSVFPSIGPYRFIWFYLIGFLLFKQTNKKLLNNDKMEVWAGSTIWILAVLWSSESGVFASALWFPYLLMNSVTYKENTFSFPLSLRNLIAKMTAPTLLLIFVVSCISLYYYVNLGALPDFKAYHENSSGFSQTAYAITSFKYGGIGVLLFILFMFMGVLSDLPFLKTKFTKSYAVLFSFIVGLLSLLSYYVVRSHENSVSNLIPFFVFVLFIFYHILEQLKIRQSSQLLAMTAIPLLLSIVYFTFGNKKYLPKVYTECATGYHSNIKSLLPAADTCLAKAWKAAGINKTDYIAFFDEKLHPSLINYTPDNRGLFWLPTNPASCLFSLPKERNEMYFRNFTTQFMEAGWLISSKNPNLKFDYRELEKMLDTKFILDKVAFEDEQWKIARYKRR